MKRQSLLLRLGPVNLALPKREVLSCRNGSRESNVQPINQLFGTAASGSEETHPEALYFALKACHQGRH